MNISWPNKAAGKAARRSAARVLAVGATAVTVAGAAAMVAPAMSAMAATHTAKHATTTTMSAVSGYVGTKVMLSAKVKGGTLPKGWVKFVWGGKTLCSATLSNGTAKCGHVFGGVGSLRVEAKYLGNAAHKPSDGVATVKVLAIKTSVKVTASPASTTTGKAVTFTAVVSPSSSAGTVTFWVGATRLGSATVMSGKATFPHTWNADGTYTVTAAYGGNATHAKSSGTTKVTVAAPPVDPTTTVVTNPLFPITAPVDTPAPVNVMVTNSVAGGPAPTGQVEVNSADPWVVNNPAAAATSCTATLAPAGVNPNGTAYSTATCDAGGIGWGFVLVGVIYTPNSTAFATSNTDGENEIKIVNLYPDTTTVTAPAGTAGVADTLVATLGGPGGGNVLSASPEIETAVPPNPDTITFTVTDDTDAVVATCETVPLAGGTTAAANYADCDVTLPAGTYTVTADFAGDEYAAPSSGTATLTIDAAG
jgi:Bacterial Ig-like domain (group 3)